MAEIFQLRWLFPSNWRSGSQVLFLQSRYLPMKRFALILFAIPMAACTGQVTKGAAGPPKPTSGSLLRSELAKFNPVLTVKPDNSEDYAEVVLDVIKWESVEVWSIGGDRGGLFVTDYQSIESPMWVQPGRYEITYGCPAEIHSYETVKWVVFERPGKYKFTCVKNDLLLLNVGKSNE